MPPSFGTSGLRGLALELTPALVTCYVQAFLAVCPHGGKLFVGRDFRVSSPEIAASVLEAAREAGIEGVDCGVLPTPALALAAMNEGAAAVMVTGSHIPGDRNGLKFYVPTGEIGKDDEARIVAAADAAKRPSGSGGAGRTLAGAIDAYARRYLDAFPPGCLSGLVIGVYRHSSVARDVLETVLAGLGARVVPLGHSDAFVPVDTEAVSEADRKALCEWAQAHGLDAVVSTDGDADRPLVADERGEVVAGDILGVLTAQALGAAIVCTPVSSNDLVRRMPEFAEVRLTRIGSPYVIAAMEQALAADPQARVAGFEANGGFLLGFRAQLHCTMPPLMTRDCLLPILAPLASARAAGKPLSALVSALPPCFSAADRLQDIDRDKAGRFLAALIDDADARGAFFAETGPVERTDLTDGLRVEFAGNRIVHLRPSGNAPEFRVYAQADTVELARALVSAYVARVGQAIA